MVRFNGFDLRISTLQRFLGFGHRKLAEFSVRFGNRQLPSQQALIDELLDQDEFLLIIFDACRFDTFVEIHHDHYKGNLKSVSTTNTYTKQFQQNTWPDEYDLTYVAGGPVISDRNFELSGLDYRPSEHFAEIVHAWEMGYQKELGVTPPEAVTEVAVETNAPRMIVHYFQPHAPYIGTYRLRESYNAPSDDFSKIERRVGSLKEIYERIELGEIHVIDLWTAYRTNLERVMHAAKPLINEVDRRTVITSDHGELLGEEGRYFHGGAPHPILCTLPWFEVEDFVGEFSQITVEVTADEQPSKSVEEQLQDLGYL